MMPLRARPAGTRRASGRPVALAVTVLSAIVAVTCSSAQETRAPRLAPQGIHGSPRSQTAPAHALALPVPGPLPGGAAIEPTPAIPSGERGTARSFAGPLARFVGALSALERGERREHVRLVWLGDS